MATSSPPEQTTDVADRIGGWCTALCLLVAIGAFFGPTMFTERSLLFRDSTHFYAPLWEWARGEWGQGRIPLWNPLQNLGVPHLAENSSSVFYPGKLLFAVPISFGRLFHSFLAGHVLLAGYTMYRLARSWGQSSVAAGIASVSYALSGGVLFQYCNPPFLIGAAWLPLAIGSASELLRRRSLVNAGKLACVLAIMVLGGDSQTVYHVGLMMVLLAQLIWWNSRNDPITPVGVAIHREERGFTHGLCWIGVAAIIAIGLAAIQLLPTTTHTANSQRADYQVPRSISELVSDAVSGKPLTTGGLLGTNSKLKNDSHYRRVFNFSVGPWRWPELLLPNVSGRWFPVNARWITSVPAEGRVWTPSLYLGLLPFCLAVGAIRARRRLSIEGRWIVWCTLIAALGSMGAYGLGWLYVDWHVFRGGTEATAAVGRPTGSLYWLMTVLLPMYVKFRYPAKLWTIATFGMSILAGMEWDRRRQLKRSRTGIFFFIGSASMVGLGTIWLFADVVKKTWSRAGITDSVFGPLNVDSAWWDVIWAGGQAAVLCFAIGIALSIRPWRHSKWLGLAMILLLTADLTVAHLWMLPSARTAELGQPPQLAANADQTSPPPRIFRSPSLGRRPKSWSQSSSADRMRDLVRWDRESLYPQYHVLTGQAVIDSTTTLPMRNWVQFMTKIRKHREETGNINEPLTLLDCSQLASMSAGDDSAPPRLSTTNAPTSSRVWAIRLSALQSETESVRIPKELIIDAECRVIQHSPQEVTVKANVSEPALIVLSEYEHADWQAEISKAGSTRTEPAPIHRVFGVMRGVVLDEPGEYLIRYSYRSRSFRIGAIISGVAWSLILLISVTSRIRGRKPA